MERGAREIALGQRQIMLMALVDGAVDGTADGKDFAFRAGDVAVFDYGRGYRSTTTDFDAIATMCDRERLPAVFNLPEAHGAVLPAASAAARLLHRQALALFETAGDLSLAEAAGAVDGVFVTAGAALTALLADSRAASFGSDVALIEQALRVIDNNLPTPNLTPLRVAAVLGWSRSTLYRVLEPLGGVGSVVRQRRLAGAARAIMAQPQARLSLRKLAAEHGFASEGHLTRAFRARFGVTPRALHDLVRRGDRLGLLTQAVRAGQAASEPWIEYLIRGGP
jgi:AraC-like DNA-binding protein